MQWTRIIHGLSFLALAIPIEACIDGGGAPVNPPSGDRDGGAISELPVDRAPACTVAGEAAIGSGEVASPVIAFGGGKFAVAWSEKGAPGVQVGIVDEHGASLGQRTIATGVTPTEPAITALPGGGFLVAWQERGTVRGARLDAEGHPLGEPFAIAKTTSLGARPDVAASAHGTAIAWTDATSALLGELGPTGLAAKTSLAGAADPSLASGSDTVAMVWTTGSRIGFAQLASPMSTITPTFLREAPGKANVPRAAVAGGGGFWVTWEDDRGGDGHESVRLARIDESGKASAEVSVPGDDGSANYPDVAALGEHAAVTYYQFRDGPPRVFLTFIGPDLRREGEDFRVSGQTPARFPRIAAGRDTLGVVYALRSGPGRVTVLTCH